MSVYHAFTQSFPLKQVARESGPPHMNSFVTRVSVGEFVGEGEGKSKKISKKNAAIAVLEELKKLPPLPTVERVKPRIKKKTKSIVRVRTCPNTGRFHCLKIFGALKGWHERSGAGTHTPDLWEPFQGPPCATLMEAPGSQPQGRCVGFSADPAGRHAHMDVSAARGGMSCR